MTAVNFEILKGETLTKVTGKIGDDRMIFETNDEKFKLWHEQD